MQVCRQLLQTGAQRLYEGYRVYANTTPLAWMQAMDATAVRQVTSNGLQQVSVILQLNNPPQVLAYVQS